MLIFFYQIEFQIKSQIEFIKTAVIMFYSNSAVYIFHSEDKKLISRQRVVDLTLCHSYGKRRPCKKGPKQEKN